MSVSSLGGTHTANQTHAVVQSHSVAAQGAIPPTVASGSSHSAQQPTLNAKGETIGSQLNVMA